MPWYKAGTVSVVLNSNAVIGTGTAFIANSRVGDAFRGPDGGWYEVTNIASDTALSISPNYQGATNAAGTYALAPMQGYVKDSADTLRALVNLYGAKLAALGTTGNYDILPPNKGGTGIADLSAFAQSLLNDADAASARTTLQLGSVATESTVPVTKGGTGGTTQATARSGLGLGSAAVAAILGTVSQSGGVPTGAIIENVVNANGRAIKFADGTMICLSPVLTLQPPTSAFGALFVSPTSTGWFFPAVFVGTSPAISAVNVNSARFIINGRATSNNVSEFVVIYPVSDSGSPAALAVAIGRWF